MVVARFEDDDFMWRVENYIQDALDAQEGG